MEIERMNSDLLGYCHVTKETESRIELEILISCFWDAEKNSRILDYSRHQGFKPLLTVETAVKILVKNFSTDQNNDCTNFQSRQPWCKTSSN